VNSPAEAARSSSTLIIATPDRLIGQIDEEVAPACHPEGVVLHLSGALPSTILARSRERGAAVGSMHPLQSFTDLEKAQKHIAGSIFACEGDRPALDRAHQIAVLLGAQPISIRTSRKPLYHAAAVAASNFLVAILTLSVDLMERMGMDRVTALRSLMPLIRGTLENAAAQGVPEALTGPVERGDVNTIEAHMTSIHDDCPHLEEPYSILTRLTIEAAARKGSLDSATAASLVAMLEKFEG